MNNTTIKIDVPVRDYGLLATAAALEGLDISTWLSLKLRHKHTHPSPAPATSMGLFDRVDEEEENGNAEPAPQQP